MLHCLVVVFVTLPALALSAQGQVKPKKTPEPEPREALTGPVACYNRARQDTFLHEDQAVRLCRCARTTAPVDCYIQADRMTNLDTYEILDLCIGPRQYGHYPVYDDWCQPYDLAPSGER